MSSLLDKSRNGEPLELRKSRWFYCVAIRTFICLASDRTLNWHVLLNVYALYNTKTVVMTVFFFLYKLSYVLYLFCRISSGKETLNMFERSLTLKEPH